MFLVVTLKPVQGVVVSGLLAPSCASADRASLLGEGYAHTVVVQIHRAILLWICGILFVRPAEIRRRLARAKAARRDGAKDCAMQDCIGDRIVSVESVEIPELTQRLILENIGRTAAARMHSAPRVFRRGVPEGHVRFPTEDVGPARRGVANKSV